LIDVHPPTDHLPIEDHGLIGDGRAAALVGRDGAVWWLCVPGFDSAPVFCGLLDRERGGAFWIRPRAQATSRQSYLPDSGVLVTQLRTASGLLRVTDTLTLRAGTDLTGEAAGRGELLRMVEVPDGELEVELLVEPRGPVRVTRADEGWGLTSPAWPQVTLQLGATAALTGQRTSWRLAAGDRVFVWLRWHDSPHGWADPHQRLDSTVADWRRWAGCIDYDGPQRDLVRRSALTLKLLDNAENGAIVAAPTSSLPEAIGGERNWDYRFTWIRDAAFSVYALRRVGLATEAEDFLRWVLGVIERDGEPRVLYDLAGRPPPAERVDPELTGYRDSRPVRWGNAAAGQVQHDVYGEILDCAYQWCARGSEPDPALWSWLCRLTERARSRWRRPDRGIWEVRSPSRPFTYSVAMCHVALDRAARLAQRLGLPGDRHGWATEAGKIRQAILDEAWEPQLDSLTEQLVGPGAGAHRRGLDASVLALPLRRVLPSSHPAMVATTAAVTRRLGAGDGLLYRYLPEESPDGVAGDEGAFLLCSFWLVDNLAGQGRLDEAGQLYESLCARANPLGLLAEQVDPVTGCFLGNFPQALSHVGVISSGLNLLRATRRKRETEEGGS
jgi:GH15 family glucan-1,4-alpha-glucosidase